MTLKIWTQSHGEDPNGHADIDNTKAFIQIPFGQKKLYLEPHKGSSLISSLIDTAPSAGEDSLSAPSQFQVFTGKGTNVIGFTNGFHNYIAFVPPGYTWQVDNASEGSIGQLRSNKPGYFSIALLPDESHEDRDKFFNLFKDSASTFLNERNGTRVFWEYDNKSQSLLTQYLFDYYNKASGDASMLVAVYPHQWDVLIDKDKPSSPLGTYKSSRGTLRLIKLDNSRESFTTVMPVNGIIPVLPMADVWSSDDADKAYSELLNSCQNSTDPNKPCVVSRDINPGENTYGEGKGILLYGELINVADELYKFFTRKNDPRKDNALKYRDQIIKTLEDKFEEWYKLSSVNDPFFYYNIQWGTFIGYPSGFGTSNEINDHMFHYGYFIHAASIIARFDTGWRDTWKDAINILVHDIANTRRDNKGFEKTPTPFLRNFDVYEGHAWASGHGNNGLGNNEESSSESMNAFAGIALWGAEIGDKEIRDLGVYLYTTGAQSINYYHFDIYKKVFPRNYNRTMCSRIFGDGGDYMTFFGTNPTFVHGINVIPALGTSLYLGYDPDYVQRNYDEIKSQPHEKNGWWGLIASYLSFSDPNAAMALWKDPTIGESSDDGDSKAHIQAFISAMGGLGHVDITR